MLSAVSVSVSPRRYLRRSRLGLTVAFEVARAHVVYQLDLWKCLFDQALTDANIPNSYCTLKHLIDFVVLYFN